MDSRMGKLVTIQLEMDAEQADAFEAYAAKRGIAPGIELIAWIQRTLVWGEPQWAPTPSLPGPSVDSGSSQPVPAGWSVSPWVTWLEAVKAGPGLPCPPLDQGATERQWVEAAMDAAEARGLKPEAELLAAAISHWKAMS